jgi:pyruvate dehydrogenase E2 component (dihydrolipoamide acetyltransferase)
MARWEFKLPDIGEGITEGEIVGWLVKPGDAVKEDQPMVEVMTDKATVTITAPKAGSVVETRGQVGEIVAVHAVLVVFELEATPTLSLAGHETNGATAPPPSGGETTRKEEVPPVPTGGNPGLAPLGPGVAASAAASFAGAVASSAYFNEKPLATPATRKLARDMSIDLRRVPPSGPQGRVTKRDLESFVRSPAPVSPSRSGAGARLETLDPQDDPSRTPARARTAAQPPGLISIPAGPGEERVPFAGLRRRIAQKMALSKQTAAHFTFVEECDVTELKAMRARLAPEAELQGAKLTFLPFIVKATVAALKKHPMLNTALDESTNELVFRKYFHIGIATATDAGLLVPVVKDADRKSILEIAREIDRLAIEARAGQAKLEDLQGSTFTITSLGVQGGLLATPIINLPEVAILGVHRMKQRAIVKNGQIVIGDVMLLSLSFDHRIVDGHVGVAFAYEIIGYLEQPDRLMLEMA